MGYDLVQSTLISVHPNSRRTVPGRSGVGFTAATARWPLPAHTSGLILLNSCPDRTSRPNALSPGSDDCGRVKVGGSTLAPVVPRVCGERILVRVEVACATYWV
jgi:hypothetical protein